MEVPEQPLNTLPIVFSVDIARYKYHSFLHCSMQDGEPHQASCYTTIDKMLWRAWE